jgi:hypothetical protein
MEVKAVVQRLRITVQGGVMSDNEPNGATPVERCDIPELARQVQQRRIPYDTLTSSSDTPPSLRRHRRATVACSAGRHRTT